MKNPWKEIKIPEKDVSALRVNPNHPLDLYWAMDQYGRYLFIYEYPVNSNVIIKNPPELEGVEIISMTIGHAQSRLVLILNERANWELFFSLCTDLLNSTIQIKLLETASSTILKRLIRWKYFFKKKRSGIFSEEKIKGLIGELLFLEKYLLPKHGICDAINFWIGPEGAPQDFNVNDSAIKIKCQGGGKNPSVKISSAEQLYSQLKNIYLYVITLDQSTVNTKNAINLPEIIEAIMKQIEGDAEYLNRFQDKLMEIGYVYSEKYFDFNYILSAENVYKVEKEFPRISPYNLKVGVKKLTYSICLADCSPYEIIIDTWEL